MGYSLPPSPITNTEYHDWYFDGVRSYDDRTAFFLRSPNGSTRTIDALNISFLYVDGMLQSNVVGWISLHRYDQRAALFCKEVIAAHCDYLDERFFDTLAQSDEERMMLTVNPTYGAFCVAITTEVREEHQQHAEGNDG